MEPVLEEIKLILGFDGKLLSRQRPAQLCSVELAYFQTNHCLAEVHLIMDHGHKTVFFDKIKNDKVKSSKHEGGLLAYARYSVIARRTGTCSKLSQIIAEP